MTSLAVHSTELHPRLRELIDYLEVHRRQLHEAVASVPPALREKRPASGGWSVAEVVEHVSMLEQRIAIMVARRAEAARASGVGPDPDTSSVIASYANPAAVVDRSNKIEAPLPVQPTGTLGAAAGERALDQSRAALAAALRGANGVSFQNEMQTHPILGPLNLYHWIVATALHDGRHAAQIREIGHSLSAD